MSPFLACLAILLAPQDPQLRKEGYLGAGTRTATAEERPDLGAKDPETLRGQFVLSVDGGSPAERAGLRVGDIITQVNGAVIFSFDSFQDRIRAGVPGSEWKLTLRRGKPVEIRILSCLLEGCDSIAAGLHWEFAGLDRLAEAKAEAKRTGRNVLVGLSGAETC